MKRNKKCQAARVKKFNLINSTIITPNIRSSRKLIDKHIYFDPYEFDDVQVPNCNTTDKFNFEIVKISQLDKSLQSFSDSSKINVRSDKIHNKLLKQSIQETKNKGTKISRQLAQNVLKEQIPNTILKPILSVNENISLNHDTEERLHYNTSTPHKKTPNKFFNPLFRKKIDSYSLYISGQKKKTTSHSITSERRNLKVKETKNRLEDELDIEYLIKCQNSPDIEAVNYERSTSRSLRSIKQKPIYDLNKIVITPINKVFQDMSNSLDSNKSYNNIKTKTALHSYGTDKENMKRLKIEKGDKFLFNSESLDLDSENIKEISGNEIKVYGSKIKQNYEISGIELNQTLDSGIPESQTPLEDVVQFSHVGDMNTHNSCKLPILNPKYSKCLGKPSSSGYVSFKEINLDISNYRKLKEVVINLEKCDDHLIDLKKKASQNIIVENNNQDNCQKIILKKPIKTKRSVVANLSFDKNIRLRNAKQVQYFPENSKINSPKIQTLENKRASHDNYELALRSLHSSSLPRVLPCRNEEISTITKYIRNCLYNRVGGCMYISGVPGTGKTAAVYQSIDDLGITRNKMAAKKLNQQNEYIEGTIFVEVNGMKLRKAQDIYVKIYQKIFDKNDLTKVNGNTKISSEKARIKLEEFFRNTADDNSNNRNAPRNKKNSLLQNKSIIVFIDELDLICKTKSQQQIVYNLFDWPFNTNNNNVSSPSMHGNNGNKKKSAILTKTAPNLIVITVANTMDLPEKLLSGRIQSRLGLDRITFQPYNHSQLQEIITSRLKQCHTKGNIPVFKPDCIQLIARKVAALTGDARKALEMCRRTLEFCKHSFHSENADFSTKNQGEITKKLFVIGMDEARNALEDIHSSNKFEERVIESLSYYEKLFLKILAAEIQDKNCEFTKFVTVYEKFETQCLMADVKPLNFTQCLIICDNLCKLKLCHLEKISNACVNNKSRKIRLNLFLLPSDINL
ncbi:unnamed protein product [Gordionus sp. m RMFG-2023]